MRTLYGTGAALAVACLAPVSAQAAPLTVTNAGFEDPALPNGESTDDTLPGWTGSGGVLADFNFGAFDAPTTFFPAEAPAGENVAYIQDGQISQTLADTLAEGEYTLTAQVGQSLVDAPSPFRVQLRAGGELLAEATTPAATAGTFALVSVSYTAVYDDTQLGQALAIALVDAGTAGVPEDEPYFDDVALDFVPAAPPCAAAPMALCGTLAKASLSVRENKPGKEKLTTKLSAFPSTTTQADFGNPVTGDTRYTLCVYDEADTLAAALRVERAGATCGPKAKPCWKDQGGKGWKYKDPLAGASGVRALSLMSGPAQKGKLQVAAGNNEPKGQTALPTGIAAALEGATSTTLQFLVNEACYGAELSKIGVAEGTRFKAKKP
jgi:hypothetical protein